jgi:hypothetical protein
MPIPEAYRAISLFDFNVGAAAAVAFLNPLAAQIDGLISLGLGPFQVSLAAQFNAALAASATLALTISIGDLSLLATLKASIAALAQLSAALSASLAFGLPPISLGLSAELSATAALAAALKVQLGGLNILIKAALAVKIPAIRAAASLTAALGAGPFFAISFNNVTLQQATDWLSNEVAGGGLNADAQTLLPGDQTFGVFIFGTSPSFQASFDAIIHVPT